jgi:hypothetical protein
VSLWQRACRCRQACHTSPCLQPRFNTQCLYVAAPSIPRRHLTGAVTSLGFGLRARLRNFGRLTPPACVRGSRVLLPQLVFRLPWIREPTMFSSPASHQRAGGGRLFSSPASHQRAGEGRLTLQERVPCDCVPQSLSRSASTAAAAVLKRKGGYPTVQNSPARLPDVGLGPRVGLPGRRQPAGYGTSWSVLVSCTGGRSCSSQPDLFHHFPSTNLSQDFAYPCLRQSLRTRTEAQCCRTHSHRCTARRRRPRRQR